MSNRRSRNAEGVGRPLFPGGAPRWDELLTPYLVQRGGRPKREALAGEVARLSALFTHPHERARLPAAYLEAPLTRAAYAAYFAVANAEKVARILGELGRYAPAFVARPEWRTLDLGAGTGAAGLGLAAALAAGGAPARVRYEAVDASAAALDDARWLLAQAAPGWEVGTRAGDAARAAPPGPFDLLFLVDVVNEVALRTPDPVAAGARLVRECLGRVAPDGYLIVVEPALRTLTRNLHAVRDALCAAGGVRVAAPCLHDRPCPALARDDAWCHEERAWNRPGIVADMDRRIGHDKRWLKYAYLVLTREGPTLGDAAAGWRAGPEEGVWRAVTNRHDTKGKTRMTGCRAEGWCEVECLARDRSGVNEMFFEIERGAVFGVTGAAGSGPRFRAAGDTGVRRLPAGPR